MMKMEKYRKCGKSTGHVWDIGGTLCFSCYLGEEPDFDLKYGGDVLPPVKVFMCCVTFLAEIAAILRGILTKPPRNLHVKVTTFKNAEAPQRQDKNACKM